MVLMLIAYVHVSVSVYLCIRICVYICLTGRGGIIV